MEVTHLVPEADGNGKLRYKFDAALGSMNTAADPEHAPKRTYEQVIKSIGTARKKSGGCG